MVGLERGIGVSLGFAIVWLSPVMMSVFTMVQGRQRRMQNIVGVKYSGQRCSTASYNSSVCSSASPPRKNDDAWCTVGRGAEKPKR